MSFNEKTLHSLEFDKICELLASFAPTDGSKTMARMLMPSDDIDTVIKRQRRTTDAKRLCDAKGMPSFGGVRDVSESCERADKGAILTPGELLAIAGVLRTSRTLQDYCYGNHLFDTVLDEMFDRLMPQRTLEDRISRAIISEELIADEASVTLANIRRQIRITNNKIKETLQKYVQGGSHAKYLQENIVTTRNGRYVIPVKAECKNEVKGLVHDTSSSGATLFIEPAAVVEANNELRVLESKEEHEIERILAELSSAVSECSNAIWLNYRNITELAFCFACAQMSYAIGGSAPMVTEERFIELKRARHPLIDKSKVVPINVILGDGYDTMIITGPNTGGKTVTLKTLGLFTLMAQSGLHVSADEGSVVCVCDDVLVDIGDEQSIEQSLSTFSSHMVNIVSFMDKVSERSLVLFDELGVGTDPVEGAALAVSIIDFVRKRGAMCAATTHYAELKAYALDTKGVCNASCEFDVETLRPTYKLIIGAPGKSNAFAISEKLGLPREIIESAENYVSSDNRKFEDIIGQLEHARVEMEKKREEMESMRADYERFKAESEKIINKRVEESERELEKSRQKAASMVASAKASSDFIMEQMEKVKKARDSERLGEELQGARRAVREHLRANSEKFDPVEKKRDENYVLPRKLKKGDQVIIMTLGSDATLLEDPDKSGNVRVQAGILQTRVKIKDLKLKEDEPTVTVGDKKQKVSSYTVQRSSSFSDEIDLRGMNGDEAWLAVDKYFDEANLYGFKRVRLIHGKGTGALKAALWKYLKGDKRISGFRIGQFGEGDGGVTVVELK
ncbi:MAG: endonuclease MutS2 [Ruminococcaceae bacterium]|nr:endonuclease MutS2 [Oscillospiraceae bacterium]